MLIIGLRLTHLLSFGSLFQLCYSKDNDDDHDMSYSIQSYIFSHVEILLKSLNRVISTIQKEVTCSCANLEDGVLDYDHDGN